MKKILFAIMLSVCVLGLQPMHATQAFATAEKASGSGAPALEEWQKEEKKIILSLREKNSKLTDESERELSTFILDRISGKIGKPIENINTRKKYYEQLAAISAMTDGEKRLAALKRFGKDPDNKYQEGVGDNTPAEKEEEALKQKQADCTKTSGTWNYSSKSCTDSSTGIVGGTGQSTQSNAGSSGNSSNNTGNSSGSSGSSGSGSSSSGSGSSGSGQSSSTPSGGSSSENPNPKEPPPPNKDLADGSGIECGHTGAKVTAYGYGGDHTSDSNSNYRCKGGRCASSCDANNGACGMGNANNLLRDNHSVAVSDVVKNACGLKNGDVICVDVPDVKACDTVVPGGRICGVYEDRSPQKFPNVDRYLPNVKACVGNNYSAKAKGRIIKLNKKVPTLKHPGK